MVRLTPVDFDPFNQPKSAPPGIARTVLDQAMQGATFGLADEITDRLGAGYASLATDEDYGSLLEEARAVSNERMAREFEENPATAIMSNLAGGLVSGVAGASTKAGQALARSLGSGNVAARIAKGAATGATSGGLYGLGATDGDTLAERFDNSGITDLSISNPALIGAVAGGAIPAAGAAASGVREAILPKASDEIAELAELAINKHGIPLRRSAMGDSRAAKVLASVTKDVPLSGAVSFMKKQGKAFNRAVAKTFGEDADKFTPELIDKAYRRIGGEFNSVLKGKSIAIGDDTLNALAKLDDEAVQALTEDTYRLVKNQVGRFLKDIDADGKISGEKINSLRSSVTKILRRTNNDASPFLSDLQDVILDSTINGLPASEAKAARETLTRARFQYKNLKTIEPLAAKAERGYISPALLQGRVQQQFKDYARGGGGDLGELARIGQSLLKDTVPNSGTVQRAGAMGALGIGTVFEPITGGSIIGGSKLFNAIDTAQPVVRNALKKGSASAGGNPAVIDVGARSGILAEDIVGSKPPRITINPGAVGKEGIPDANVPRLTPVDGDPFQGEKLTIEPLSYNIPEHEGLRHTVYADTVGKPTVGYGFNMDSGIARKVWKQAGIPVAFDDVKNGAAAISDAQAQALGQASQQIAIDDAKSLFPSLPDMSEGRQAALINLSYQLGKTKLSGFSEFRAAMNRGDHREAARKLLRSKYAKQTPNRARDIARLIISG
jgi:GH24 family phage-related lysozyme (muramidase)